MDTDPPSVASVKIRVAIGLYDRTRPLFDGGISADDRLDFVAADTQESTMGLIEGRYDAAEMSLATYVKLREEGDALRALPIFTHRKFFHQYVWTRRGSGISSLAKLRGRRVVAPMYWMTSSIWHRLILEDEAAIDAGELRWMVLAPDRLPSMRPPPGVSVELVAGRSAIDLLVSGAADALFAAATLPDLVKARDALERPFADGEAQRRWFERTDIFPPVHALVCRSDVLAERRAAVSSLVRSIEAAKRLAYVRLEDESRTSLPFLREHLEDTRRAFGADPYRDGLEVNRGAIEAFAAAAHRQGLTARAMKAEELFDVIEEDRR